MNIIIKFTWRFVFWVILMCVNMFFVVNALINYYEYKPFAGFAFFIFIMSYIFSLFLIQEDE